jgi:TolB protein
MTTPSVRFKLLAALLVGASGLVVAQQPQQPPKQPTTVELPPLTGEAGAQTRLAVPDLIALSTDRETQEAARVVSQVLWDDVNFEREFYMIPRDTYKSIPVAASMDAVPYDRWRELGADGVIIGTVQRQATGIRVELRLYNVRARQQIYGREYTGSAANPRIYAHTFSDELHQSQRNMRGVARTKLTFSSDRNREAVVGTVEKRDVKEVYVTDYDGAGPRRITINRALNVFPSWSPDGRSIAYTSYRSGVPDILISNIYAGTMESPTKGVGQNWLPVFSPDGTRIAFNSNRDGNPPPHQPSGDRFDADVVAGRHADRLCVGPDRFAAGLHDWRRRLRAAAHFTGVVGGPPDLVARAVQRDRLFRAHRARIRHQDPQHCQRRDAADHVR